MFCRDEKVVYPGYGLAIIQDIITKDITGKKNTFFQLKFVNKDMTILVPTHKIEMMKLRKLSTVAQVDSAIHVFSDKSFFEKWDKHQDDAILVATWTKRQKDYQLKIHNGDLCELCIMYLELKLLEIKKELSFGEKAILRHIEDLLVEEMAAVRSTSHAIMRECLRNIVFMNMPLDKKAFIDNRNAVIQK
jgi:CarD family transcriptional regulator